MRRKAVCYMLMLVFAVAVVLCRSVLPGGERVQPVALSRSVPAVSTDNGPGYTVDFDISKYPESRMVCYVPSYGQTDHSTVKLYASFFDAEEYPVAEDGDAYIYRCAEGLLTIYKHMRRLTYTATQVTESELGIAATAGAAPLTDQEAVAYAEAFFDEHMLVTAYDEARVSRDDGLYTVELVESIGNIKKYAFNNQVTLDRMGRVLQADYYFTQYERLGYCGITSLRDAFWALPDDIDTGVTLTDGQLVYVYEDSIVQPVYLFKGETSDGRTFEYFVKSAVFDA